MPSAEGRRFRTMQQISDSLSLSVSKSGSVSSPGLDATAIPIASLSPTPYRGAPPLAVAAAIGVLLALSSQLARAAEPDLAVPGLIGFDLHDLDTEGLIGPPDGKRAVDYEFCIPVGAAFMDEVSAIDTSARFYRTSRGRIGCGPDEVLVLGNTHQPDFAVVLHQLANLPYVEHIQRAWLE